ncbi:MAG TPA: hypothetical protein VGD37_37925 [Kofleriaceae bacterium]
MARGAGPREQSARGGSRFDEVFSPDVLVWWEHVILGRALPLILPRLGEMAAGAQTVLPHVAPDAAAAG